MTALAWYLYQRGRHNTITISLLDEPNPELLEQMVTIDEQVDINPLYDVPYSFENRTEWIYSKPSFPTNVVPGRQSKSHPANLMLSLADPTNGAHIHIEYMLDEPKRLGRLIDKELKHFSHETTNLLIIDTKEDLFNAKDRAQVITRRLQPNINRRLSGVLLLSEFYMVNGIKIQREWELISNPHAYNPLSSSLQEFLGELGSYQLW